MPSLLVYFFMIVLLNNIYHKTIFMVARDGATISLWQDSVESFNPKNDSNSNILYDVAIVGGGITGLSTALLLQEAGLKCILFEASTIGYGTSGGTTAHLNTIMDTPYNVIAKNFGEKNARLVAEAAKNAIELIKYNIDKYNIDCDFGEVPAYIFSQTKSQSDELDEIYKATLAVGVEIEYVNNIPISNYYNKAVKVNAQARFHPLKYVLALANAFDTAGGVIKQFCRVIGVEEQSDLAMIETSAGNFSAKYLIYATHIPIGINLLHLRCTPYRSYVMAVKLKSNEEYPDALIYDLYDPYHYYRTQQVKGEKYLIVGGEDHKTGHEENTGKCFIRLESHIVKNFNVDEIVYKWSSQYYEPADGLPYIGHLPGHSKNILVATGYGGNGITYSGVAALLLSDIILGKENNYTSLFNPGRVKPIAGFVNFIKQNADVIAQLFGKVIPLEKLHELVELAPGEASVVKYGKQRVAIYKDDRGKVYAINPVCTHMKCIVSWNVVEKSWDCSCHGARYNCNGEVLNGPTSLKLEAIELPLLIEEKHS